MELKPPTVGASMNALYVSIKEKQVQSPEDTVIEDETKARQASSAPTLHGIQIDEF
jgi:hypothetical protein